MPLQLIRPATLPALTLPTARQHLRVSSNSDDALILGMIAAATQDAEAICQRALMDQGWRLTMDEWGCAAWIALRRPPVTSVDAVQYAAAGTGTLTALTAGTDYQVDLSGPLYARVAPAYGKSWPAARCQLSAVQIDFSTGWTDPAQVPELIQQWLLMRVQAYYENKSAWTRGERIERNEFVDAMLDQWKAPGL